MMKLWLKRVLYLILGLICAGCVNKNGQYLALASDCMEVSPDSAIAILRKVENIGEESHSQQAFFALLWTQARHKCHLPIENDSLISVATNYYMKKGEKHLAAKALLYKGLVHKQRKEVELTAEAFAMSEQWFEGVEDDQYKALLYNHYGALMMGEKNFEEAIFYLKKSYYYKLKGDSIHYIMSACASIAKNFKYLNQLDSAQTYFEKGLQYKNAVSSDRYFVYVKDYANFLRENNELEKAESLLLECEQNIMDEQRYSLYSSLATLYYETKDYAKALAYAERMKESTDSLMMRGYYLHLYRIHTKLGNKDVAHDCYKRYTDIHDALQARLKTKEVAVIPHKVEKQMQEVKIRKVSTQRSWLMGAVALLAILSVIVYKVLRARNRTEKSLREAAEQVAKENATQYEKERGEWRKERSEKDVKIGNLKSIITHKDHRIERIETENLEKKTTIKELKGEVNRLKVEEEGAQRTEKMLKKGMEEQLHRQEELEERLAQLERERWMQQLTAYCAQHKEKEKLMELLNVLNGGETCRLKISEYVPLIKMLADKMCPDMTTFVTAHVNNENKRLICYLIALGFDNIAAIQKLLPLNEKTVKRYYRECEEMMEGL